MNNELTPKEKQLMEIGQQKGFVTATDVRAVYRDPKYGRAQIERLVSIRYFALTSTPGRFAYLGRPEGDASQKRLY